jgi:hypothetical protein
MFFSYIDFFFAVYRRGMFGQIQKLPLGSPSATLQIEILPRIVLRLLLQAENVKISDRHSINKQWITRMT